MSLAKYEKLEDIADDSVFDQESHDDHPDRSEESSFLMNSETENNTRKGTAMAKRLKRWRKTVAWVLLGAAIGVAATLLTTFACRLNSRSNRMVTDGHTWEGLNCGSSPEEARARGCKFDIMSFSWLPSACYDDELSDEFTQMRTWEWFSRNDSTSPLVPQDIVRQGDHPHLFVSDEYHFYHCTFMWRKLHRATLGVRYIDSYIYDYKHTKHCLMMLNSKSPTTITTAICMKYPSCWPVLSSH